MENKKTPLYDTHVQLGARMVPFAGWLMPVQYSGVIDEHRAVREAAGLFDVSHMGEIEITGPEALDAVQLVSTNDAAQLSENQAQYTVFCTSEGGIVDDAIIYKISGDHYFICVNASNVEKDFNWIREQVGKKKLNAKVKDVSSDYAQLAIQGPEAVAIVNALSESDLRGIAPFTFRNTTVNGTDVMVSATGYTGEPGFELYFPAEKAVAMFDAIMEEGRPKGLKPVGLGARDTLRLEMKYSLYGNDIDAKTTPLEANLGWVVKFHKTDFIGKEALVRQKEKSIDKKLVCIKSLERSIPRQGYEIHHDGRQVGIVTSGTLSPSLGFGIAMGYVESCLEETGQKLDIIIRGKPVKAEVVPPPFYKKMR